MKLTIVPNRNAMLLSVAFMVAFADKYDTVAYGAHAGDHAIYPDCREDFMQAMGNAMRLGTYAHVQLLRPFIALTKGGIAAEGSRLGVDFGQTWSCYKGGAVHCGKCGTCVERREAFAQAGLADPTVYAETPPLPAAPTS